VREQLRGAASAVIDRLWRPAPADPPKFERLYVGISGLEPKTGEQRELLAETSSLFTELSRSRWLLAARQGTAISTI